MSAPSILVVGAGSAGARHAQLLADAGADVTIMDPDHERARAVASASAIPFDLAALGGHDGIVIASPTRFHAEQLGEALAFGANVLVEKPLAMSMTEVKALRQHAARVMVGYNLRFHAPVERIVDVVHDGRIGRPLSVRVWFGSHLANWRPTADYRTTYSARADLGGGILLDASHELDLLIWLLGDGFDVLAAHVGRVGDLEIDVEDTVRALLRHRTGVVVEVAFDMVSRRYRRGIEVVGTEGTARLDWAREVIEIETAEIVDREPAAEPVLESYARQAHRFLEWIQGREPASVDFDTGAASVALADAIRRAAP